MDLLHVVLIDRRYSEMGIDYIDTEYTAEFI